MRINYWLISFLLVTQFSIAQISIQDYFPPTMHPQVKSWKYLRDEGIIKQNLDYSCGAAAIATLLNRYYGQSYSEADILERLLQEAQESWRASFADMQKILPNLGFQAQGYALSFEQLQHLRAPVIVYLRYRNNEHFSVLYGINRETVLLADPALGHLSLSREQFLSAWQTRESELSGKILAIVPNAKQMSIATDFFTNVPQRKSAIALQIEMMQKSYR